jgi:dolichol-phosphate mannosyltransferase
MKDLSIIIPARNEEKRIRNVVTFFSHFKKHYGKSFEIIVVIDDSTDDTQYIISRICSKYPQIKSFYYSEKLNKGGAVAKGIEHASGKIITYADVDGSVKPNELEDLIDILNVVKCDGVVASRYSGGAKLLVKQTRARRIASRGFNFLVRHMFNLHFRDTQCGAKVFKKEVAKKIAKKLYITDMAFDVNLLYNAEKNNFDVREIPIFWENDDDSTVDVSKVMPSMFLSLIRLWMINNGLGKIVDNKVTGYVVKSLKLGEAN